MVRAAAVAGTWYPRVPGALAREVDGYLNAASEGPPGEVRAIVSPHAGLMFSGPVAAYAYKAARAGASRWRCRRYVDFVCSRSALWTMAR